MANTIRVSFLDKMPDYVEFDYKNPVTDQRIRRKIKASQYQADLLKDLLDNVIEHELDKEDTIQLIRTNSFYTQTATYLEDAICSIYFNYIEKIPANVIECETAKVDLLNSYFSLDYDANYCFLGKAGVGKSTLIKKISHFWENEEISFPFTDTSRTSTFPSDYCFVPKENNFKFMVLLNSQPVTDIHINECIERAVNKMIDLYIVHPEERNDDTAIDSIFESFVTDPAQTFDIRYSLGRYIKTTSPAFQKPENQMLIHFWTNLFFQFKDIIGAISNNKVSEQKKEALYYQLLFSDAVKGQNSQSGIYNAYKYIMQLINDRSMSVKNELLKSLLANPNVRNYQFDFNSDLSPYFYCELDNINTKDFYDFIQIFTTKKASFWGKSLFNIVNHLRIEVPLNPKLSLPQKGFSFVIQDTIGIAHSNDGNGGFENSTSLKTDDLDAIVLLDDSRLNGDNNITAVIQHLVARMDPTKIYFAFSFFDNLFKEDFDIEDDIDEQRKNYLISTESNCIRNILNEEYQTRILTNKLHSNDTTFLKGLMESSDFSSVQNLLNLLITKKLQSTNGLNVFKPDPSKPFVSYDYRKLPLLYERAINSFYNQQQSIYFANPPHYKTTEALTNRLSRGIKSFNGSRNLQPVDDLYHQLITSLSTYIDTPAIINVQFIDDATSVETIINQLKSKITEELRNSINSKFLSPKAIVKWKELYMLSGTGSDKDRREGIIKEEHSIAPNVDFYLSSTLQDHIIDTIEEAFEISISIIAEKYNL